MVSAPTHGQLPANHMYANWLAANPASFVAMSPTSFIERTDQVYPDKLAVAHGKPSQT